MTVSHRPAIPSDKSWSFHNMFRFTIRDVLWLTVVVAMGIGWWLDHRQFSPTDRVIFKEIKRQSKDIEWQSYPPLPTP